MARFPERIVEKAVERMLPRGPLFRQILGNLRVYKGEEHPHAAQQPENARRRRPQPQERERTDMATLQSLADLGQQQPQTAAPEAPRYEKKIDAQGRAYATGKRKDAVARVWIKPGPARSRSTRSRSSSISRGPCCA